MATFQDWMNKHTTFDKWLTDFLVDKGIAPDDEIHMMTTEGTYSVEIGEVVGLVLSCSDKTQREFQKKVIELDAADNHIVPFLAHIAYGALQSGHLGKRATQ